jgi:hypothetical protein
MYECGSKNFVISFKWHSYVFIVWLGQHLWSYGMRNQLLQLRKVRDIWERSIQPGKTKGYLLLSVDIICFPKKDDSHTGEESSSSGTSQIYPANIVMRNCLRRSDIVHRTETDSVVCGTKCPRCRIQYKVCIRLVGNKEASSYRTVFLKFYI